MKSIDELRRKANFVDVVTAVSGWDGGETMTVYRFPNDEVGYARAVQYRNAYNESLREAMNLPKADLELGHPDWSLRPDEYRRALRVEQYRDYAASLTYVEDKTVIGNDDPMPTDYPHNF